MSLDYTILIRKKIFSIAERQTNILKCTLNNNSKKCPAKLGMHLFGNSELKLELLLVLGPADNDPSWSLAVTRPENKGVSLLTNIPISCLLFTCHVYAFFRHSETSRRFFYTALESSVQARRAKNYITVTLVTTVHSHILHRINKEYKSLARRLNLHNTYQ